MIGPSPISLIFRLKDLSCKMQLIFTFRFLRLQGLRRNLEYKIVEHHFFLSSCTNGCRPYYWACAVVEFKPAKYTLPQMTIKGISSSNTGFQLEVPVYVQTDKTGLIVRIASSSLTVSLSTPVDKAECAKIRNLYL